MCIACARLIENFNPFYPNNTSLGLSKILENAISNEET